MKKDKNGYVIVKKKDKLFIEENKKEEQTRPKQGLVSSSIKLYLKIKSMTTMEVA